MEARTLLAAARAASGLTQEAVARRAHTSQPTLSAYERGHKSPNLDVLERILNALGWELDLVPRVTFEAKPLGHNGREFHVPNRLWRLPPADCFAPLDVWCRPPKRGLHMRRRLDRIVAYVWLLEHGEPADLLMHIDGALLIEGWQEIRPNLHDVVRDAWEPLTKAPPAKRAKKLTRRQIRASTAQEFRAASAEPRLIRKLFEWGLDLPEVVEVLNGERDLDRLDASVDEATRGEERSDE